MWRVNGYNQHGLLQQSWLSVGSSCDENTTQWRLAIFFFFFFCPFPVLLCEGRFTFNPLESENLNSFLFLDELLKLVHN